jgi:hypothetical protein
MPFLPSRRWFRFRLSTWFVLVGLAAWVMASKPVVPLSRYNATIGRSTWYFAIGWDGPEFVGPPMRPKSGHFTVTLSGTWQKTYRSYEFHILTDRLIYPSLGLLVFLAWKATWAVAERRRRRPAAPE